MLLPATNEIKELLEDAVSFSFKIGKQDQLLALLYRMGHGWHNNGKEYACILYKDFVKHSFGFACYQLKDIQVVSDKEYNVNILNSNPWMCGGLIYHGSGEETFCVQLNPSDGWSINT